MMTEPKLTTDTRQASWRRRNAAKYRAHLAVQRGLCSGEITRQPCEVCGHRLCCTNRLMAGVPLSPDRLIPRAL